MTYKDPLGQLAHNTTRKGDVPGGLGLKLLREFLALNGGRIQIVSDRGYWECAAGHETVKRFEHPIAAGASPVIESLILSEYLNRYLRLEYDAAWRRAYPKFKDFRHSSDFAPLAQSASSRRTADSDVRRTARHAPFTG